MPAIRKNPDAEISLADLVAQMPDGCRAREELDEVYEFLVWAEDYFDQRADVNAEGDPMEFEPNREMCLREMVRGLDYWREKNQEAVK